MKAVEKLISMGCGNEIINSQVERGKIYATIWNAKDNLKYCKYALKSGIYNKNEACLTMKTYLSNLNDVKPLAEKYHELWMDKFNEIYNQTAKFINTNSTL